MRSTFEAKAKMPSNIFMSKKYKNYTQSDMTNALINIKSRIMSVSNASKIFKIPQRTLYDRIKKLQIEEYTRCDTANIESFLEPEIIIEEKPYPLLNKNF